MNSMWIWRELWRWDGIPSRLPPLLPELQHLLLGGGYFFSAGWDGAFLDISGFAFFEQGRVVAECRRNFFSLCSRGEGKTPQPNLAIPKSLGRRREDLSFVVFIKKGGK